jgi:hypothetical protein
LIEVSVLYKHLVSLVHIQRGCGYYTMVIGYAS